MKDFVKGFFFLLQGFNQLKNYKPVRKWFFIPLFIDFVLLASFLTWGTAMVNTWVAAALSFTEVGGVFFDIIYYPLFILAWLSFVVIAIYLIFILSSIVAAPFNALVAESVLRKKGLIQRPPRTFQQEVMLVLQMFKVSLVKAVVFLFIALISFIIAFIPGLNFVAAFVTFMVIAFDCFDYSFEVMEMSFSERIRFFKKNVSVFSGMALCLMLTLVIPGLTIVVLPLGVLGASALMSELKYDYKTSNS